MFHLRAWITVKSTSIITLGSFLYVLISELLFLHENSITSQIHSEGLPCCTRYIPLAFTKYKVHPCFLSKMLAPTAEHVWHSK